MCIRDSLEASYESDIAIAEELEVTPHLLEVWKNYTATNNRLQRKQRQYAETA